MKDADKKWKKVNNRIRMCLREAAAICLEQGHITPNEYDDFFVSGNTFDSQVFFFSIQFSFFL